MRQARIDAVVHWPREPSDDRRNDKARRDALLTLAAAMALGTVYMFYGGSVTIDSPVLEFGSQIVGGEAAKSKVTLTGTGLRTVTIGPAALEGGASTAFQIVENPCFDAALAPGATCSIVLSFSPTAPGLQVAWLTVEDETLSEPRRIALVGLGQQAEAGQAVVAPKGTPGTTVAVGAPPPAGVAAMRVLPRTLTFSRQPIGSSSPAKKVAVMSAGTAPLKVGAMRLRGDYGDFQVDSSACENQTLDPSRTCAIGVSFAPRAGRTGDRRASLVILDNTSAKRQEVELLGSASRAAAAPAELTVTPPALQFPGQYLGGKSAPSVFSVANASTRPLGPVDIALGDATNFSMGSNNCAGTTLQPGNTCEFEILFTPTDSRMLYGTLSIRATGQRQMVIISGKGLDPGWCCIGQQVVQLEAAACTSQRGGHFATKKAADNACTLPAQQIIK